MPMPRPGVDFDEAEHPPAPEDHPMHVSAVAAGITQWGFDYAWQNLSPAGLVRLLLGQKAQFAARYINDPGGKGLTQGEVIALDAANITIAPVYETSGTDFRGGFSVGKSAGQAAASLMHARGAPPGSLLWFAIDTDTGDYSSVNNYLRGAKAGSGAYIAQLYGKDGVCDAAAQAGLGNNHWQTYAWSGGRLSKNALLYQFQNGVMIGGISMDRDRTLKAMSGPWAHSAVTPPKPPTPPHPTPATDWTKKAIMSLPTLGPSDTDHAGGTRLVHRIQILVKGIGQWNNLGAVTNLTVNGNYDTATVAGVKAIQKFFGLPQDGICGQKTWTKLIGA